MAAQSELGTARRGAKPYTTWTAYQGGAHSSQYSALDQINKSNVSQLEVAWTYPVAGNITFNPIVVDNVMYVQGTGNAIVALDAATGKELWSHAESGRHRRARAQLLGEPGPQGSPAALSERRQPDRDQRADRRDDHLVRQQRPRGSARGAVARGAQPAADEQSRTDLREPVHHLAAGAGRRLRRQRPPTCRPTTCVTGKIAWVFHSIPHPGEFGYDTWPEGAYKKAGGVHNWSEFTVDEQNGIAFIPFGTARFDFYGGDRDGNNLFANSLVALDARTGKRLWHQQLVHHDLWDYDLPQAPKLLTLRQNGRNIDVVAQATKFGFIFVFERKTGKPVFPIEERPVPQTDVPGEVSWPTQPFPTKPAPFARQSFTEKDINPYLPEAEKERLRQLLKNVRNEGLFTPPSLEGSIQLPGHNGGANWGSTAVDPTAASSTSWRRTCRR